MPYIACVDKNKKIKILAKECTVNDEGKDFYCQTEGCKAILHIVCAGDEENCHFRRLPSSPHHISSECSKYNIDFITQKYDESRFSISYMFDYLLKTPNSSKHKGNSGTNRQTVGGITSLKTLPMFYMLADELGVNETYNNILIGDIFCNEDNYELYVNGKMEGEHIIETSYFTKEYQKSSILFNFPCNWYNRNYVLVRVNFSNIKECFDYYKKFNQYNHKHPIVIAGNWVKINDTYLTKKGVSIPILYECEFISARQFHIPK